MTWPQQAHVLNVWSLAIGATLSSRIFRRRDLVEGSRPLGVCFEDYTWFPVPSLRVFLVHHKVKIFLYHTHSLWWCPTHNIMCVQPRNLKSNSLTPWAKIVFLPLSYPLNNWQGVLKWVLLSELTMDGWHVMHSIGKSLYYCSSNPMVSHSRLFLMVGAGFKKEWKL